MANQDKTLREHIAAVGPQIDAVLASVAKDNSEVLRDAVFMHMRKTGSGSPIEVLFAAWWIAIQNFERMPFGVGGLPFVLVPQVPVDGGRYRLDFQIQSTDPGRYDGIRVATFPLLGVELDGHDFHERTKEQVIHRNTRDRDLQRDGWRIFHVSGSELYRQGYEVVSSIFEIAHTEWVDREAAMYLSGQADIQGNLKN